MYSVYFSCRALVTTVNNVTVVIHQILKSYEDGELFGHQRVNHVLSGDCLGLCVVTLIGTILTHM